MNLKKIKEELLLIDCAENIYKDILIVVYNQYDFVKNCIDCIYKNTKNFNLFIWNNGSDKETSCYLEEISQKENVKLYNSAENLGFIIPNNKMIKETVSPYVILLNSDTEVRENWDKVLISFLENNKDVAVTGYEGGILNKKGLGIDVDSGYDVDYICGYCMCLPIKTYLEFGLFDEENIKFAYCEDSDFSLRLKEKNKKIYACYSKDLVVHYGNRTSVNILNKEFSETVSNNLNYIKKRWNKYLINCR